MMAVDRIIRHPLASEPLDTASLFAGGKALVEGWLSVYTPSGDNPESIFKAMGYSVFTGGKRFRPVLAVETCRLLGCDPALVAPFATAVELIHTYSLIHDDLPCMDNDDFRRGNPTNHKVYGEAIALLAGDALLTEAFNLVAREGPEVGLSCAQCLEFVAVLSEAAGVRGMVAGQVMDMEAEGAPISLDQLQLLHSKKTGTLIKTAVAAGAIVGNASPGFRKALDDYAGYIGLAFQITDDILDIDGNAAILGKPVGSDDRNDKTTYPRLLGVGRSRELAMEYAYRACECLEVFESGTEPLAHIAYHVVNRQA